MEQGLFAIRRANPSDARAIASIHVDSWRTTYKGLLPDELLAGLSVATRERFWAGTFAASSPASVTLIVHRADHEAAGFVSGGAQRTLEMGCDAELYAIYFREQYQRQGLGRRLVAAFAREIEALGFSSMSVWVLAENPSRLFYESLGGKVIAEKQIERGGKSLLEVAYGWHALYNLTQ